MRYLKPQTESVGDYRGQPSNPEAWGDMFNKDATVINKEEEDQEVTLYGTLAPAEPSVGIRAPYVDDFFVINEWGEDIESKLSARQLEKLRDELLYAFEEQD